MNIKNSFADCSKCKLLEEKSCILETNCKDDLNKVDVIFVAENPGTEEVKGKKPTPLIGKAGKIFRKYFKKFELDKLNYLLTNTVLCLTLKPDGKTGNPDDETIELCKENCFKIIEKCNPKLIVLMGTSPMKAFGIAKSNITNLRGQIYKWRDYDVFLTVHPSFINYNRAYETKFSEDLLKVSELLGGDIDTKSLKVSSKNDIGVNDVFNYKIPEKYYTDDYRLVDIQFHSKAKEVLYFFRDKDNNKEVYKTNDDYYCYQTPKGVEPKKILPFKDLKQVKIPYKQKTNLDPTITYEGDIKIGVKHAMDYFIHNKGEAKAKDMNIMYVDIEVYSETNEFPHPIDAKYPLVILTYAYHGKVVTYALDYKSLFPKTEQKIVDSKNAQVTTFKTEKKLLETFIKDIKKLDPDVITGWNVIGFDIAYIFNRIKNIGIKQTSMSKFGEIFVDAETGYSTWTGLALIDQLVLYKEFTFGQKENYRLGTIAKIELGQDKLDDGEMFNDMYKRDVNKAVEYNIRDVTLLVDLEEKLKHITLQNELKQICKTTFRGSATPFGRIDALSISYLKEKGLASRNSDQHTTSEKFEGAFVKEPIKGIHDWVVDFDFTSLYPSIILTYNIGLNTFAFKFKNKEYGYYYNYDMDKLPNKFKIIVDPVFAKKEIEITKEQLIKKVKDQNLISTISGCFFIQHDKEQSFYSEILDMLLTSRKSFKNKMFEAMQAKNDDMEQLYNTRQMVFKILANAMYGVLGNSNFRFFDRDCARSITLSGQEAIKYSIMEGNNLVESFDSGEKKEVEKLQIDEMYGDLSRETPYVITGDTDSLFITYGNILDKSKPVDEIIKKINKWNKKVEEYLNKDIIEKIVSSKNVDLKYNRLNLKNELVIKRGLFLAKKRYSIHVIEQEGTKKDKVQSMGLEIKRSDFPSFTKECLQELLDIILKEDKISIRKINEFIRIKEKEFLIKIRNGDKTIARPAAFTKKLKDYKVLTPGVKGMIAWNKIIYDIFIPGSRGYLYKISGIDFDKAPKEVMTKYNKEYLDNGEKIETIVIPDEESKLPEYFIPDVKAILKFAWTDRYNLLLEPILEVKTQQEVLTF